MLVRKIVFCVLVIFCFAAETQAQCRRQEDMATVMLNLDMGKVVVNPNLKVGDVIAQHVVPIAAGGRAFYCEAAGDLINGDVITTTLSGGNNKIYQTNIPGVGIQFQRGTNTYPYDFAATREAYITISAGEFYVTLYKTAEFVGSGAIAGGIYTTYSNKAEGTSSALSSFMNENGTIIVSPSCTVSSGAEQNVYLPPINYTQLPKVGATAGDTPFSIALKCSGGASVNVGYDKVDLTFSGTVPDGMSSEDGVLVNSDTSSAGAKGVGVQIVDSADKKLTFDRKYLVGTLANPSSSYTVLSNYSARYYRYGDNITNGKVEAKMAFNITYD